MADGNAAAILTTAIESARNTVMRIAALLCRKHSVTKRVMVYARAQQATATRNAIQGTGIWQVGVRTNAHARNVPAHNTNLEKVTVLVRHEAAAMPESTGRMRAQQPKALAPSAALEIIQLLVQELAGLAPAVAIASPETTGRVRAQQLKARAHRVLTDHTLLHQTKALAPTAIALLEII